MHDPFVKGLISGLKKNNSARISDIFAIEFNSKLLAGHSTRIISAQHIDYFTVLATGKQQLVAEFIISLVLEFRIIFFVPKTVLISSLPKIDVSKDKP